MKKRLICVVSLICLGLVAIAVFVVPALFVDIYNLNGATMSVSIFDLEQHKKEGWYEKPVTTVYAPDGKKDVVYTSNVEKRIKDGWYEKPVTTVYAADGRRDVVYTSDVKSKVNDGWYREPVALMNKGSEEKYVLFSEIEHYRNGGWLLKEYYFGLTDLGEQIKQYIEQKSGSFGIYIKNLDTNEFLVLNDDAYPSASIIKLFEMAGIYSEFENGNLENNDTIQRHLELMITNSDNSSSNRLVGILGHGDYQAGFEIENQNTNSIGCFNTQHKSLFLDGGYFVAYGSNRASPYDCGIVLEKIYDRTLVSPEYSDEMLSLLKRQTRRNKIPYYLPKGTVCANKTGETSTVESDVGIVYSPGCDYIICVLTNNARSGVEDIQQISRMTYKYFNKK